MTDGNVNIKENCIVLDRSYSFWYHNPEQVDWSPESYTEILTFNTLQEFWYLDKFIKKDMIENGMFFIMIDGVMPIWEDKNNINGGCISWKVDRKYCYKYWIDCVGHFIMKNLSNFTHLVNGVSISPKKNSSIIKLWFKEDIDMTKLILPDTFCMVDDKVIYKSHVQNIDKDKIKRENRASLLH
jgi:translation initiation factor 4E